MGEHAKAASSEQLAMMIRGILRADGDVIGCEDCFELLDRYADLLEAGVGGRDLYPEVERHLEDCAGCSEELGALLTALRGASAQP